MASEAEVVETEIEAIAHPRSRLPLPALQSESTSTSTSNLHEFHSLLEAAQRISRITSSLSPPTRILRASHTDTHDLRRRVPLTRQYSGRPHIPGEDSGSEEDDTEEEEGEEEDEAEDEECEVETSDPYLATAEHASRSQQPATFTNMDTDVDVDVEMDMDMDTDMVEQRSINQFLGENIRRLNGAQAYLHAAHTSTNVTRQSVADRIERDRESLRRAVALNRDLRRHQQTRRLRDEVAVPERDRESPSTSTSQSRREQAMLDTSAPITESFTDTRPSSANGTSQPPARSRSNSVRRWRPAERLQDYASTHQRRESREDHALTSHTPTLDQATSSATRMTSEGSTVPYTFWTSRTQDTIIVSASANVGTAGHTTRPSDSEATHPDSLLPRDSTAAFATTQLDHNGWSDLSDHEEIVSRVDRALQEYRLARRAFRSVQGDQSTATHGSLSTLAEISAARASRRQASGNYTTDPLSTLSWEERWRRDDSVRQRASDQVRERRRRGLSNLQDPEDLASYTSGPLFDAPPSATRRDGIRTHGERARVQDRTRRLIERAKQDELRANNEYLKKAKASLRYLASLRQADMTPAKAWTHADLLGLHNQSLDETPSKHLPLALDDLPEPHPCSWLEPGMVWSGTQSADEQNIPTLLPQRVEQTTQFSDGYPRQDADGADTRSNVGLSSQREDRDGQLGRRALDTLTSSMQLLEDADHSLGQMLEYRSDQRTERRLELEDRLRILRSRNLSSVNIPDSRVEPVRTKDHWEVQVTLHSVNWEQMTLSGTMTASQIGNEVDKETATACPTQSGETSMDSFFTGEIIDFSQYGMDTLSSAERYASPASPPYRNKRQQDEWRVGGFEADLHHWAGIGPFKEEIEKVLDAHKVNYRNLLQKAGENMGDDTTIEVQPRLNTGRLLRGDYGEDLTLGGANDDKDKLEVYSDKNSHAASLSDAELEDLRLDTMHKLLTNKDWLNSYINADGWILMRWKERCFVSPGTGPNPEPTRPWIPSRAPAHIPPPLSAPDGPREASWFRFAQSNNPGAVNQRDAQIYSTNAEEREGFGAANGNSTGTQPSWGLTISGFYYVALNRRTGEVEALYYDCSSAPYQRLKLRPTTVTSSDSPGMGNHGTEYTMNEHIGGLRTDFSLVEFR